MWESTRNTKQDYGMSEKSRRSESRFPDILKYCTKIQKNEFGNLQQDSGYFWMLGKNGDFCFLLYNFVHFLKFPRGLSKILTTNKASLPSQLFSLWRHCRDCFSPLVPSMRCVRASPSWVPEAAWPAQGICLLEGARSNHFSDLCLFQNTQNCSTKVLISSVQNDEEVPETNPKSLLFGSDGVNGSVYSSLTVPMCSKEQGFRQLDWLRKLKALFQGE